MSVSIWLAFGAGILSFISPCTLPLFPSYLGYISGISFQSITSGQNVSAAVRWRAFRHALCFCLGLSFLFILLGFSASAVGHALSEYKNLVRVVGGFLVISFGLFMAGVLKSKWLLRERRLTLPQVKSFGYIGSFLVGIAFAAGWTPCIGPILSSVLMLTITNPAVGGWYMVAYAVGFVIPFLVLAITLTSVRPLLRYTEMIARIGGWLLVLMGVLLLTNKLALITAWIQRTTGFSGF